MENQTSFLSKVKVSYVIIGVIVLLALWMWSSYNSLTKSNIAVDNQWAQVEVQYQRRFDLIPNLVAATKGIAQQEKDVFGQIANARQGYAGAHTTDEKVAAANNVESAIGRLLLITENYPQLRSTEAFTNLQAELAGTENRVSVERSRFNEAVTAYNTLTKVFPGKLMASIFGFHERPYFAITSGAADVPKVDFTK